MADKPVSFSSLLAGKSARNTPSSEEPVLDEPLLERPIPEEPVHEEAVLTEPVSDEPVLEERVHKEPVRRKPVLEKARRPATPKPIVQEPVLRDASEGDFTMWPNGFWRDIAPTLDPVELPVLCQLYYLGSGKHADGTPKNGIAKVSLPRLAELSNKSVSGVRSATNRLIARGLLERFDTDGDSSDWYARGTRWRAIVERIRPNPGDGKKGFTGKAPASSAPKKEDKKDSQKERVFDRAQLHLMAVRILLKYGPMSFERLFDRVQESLSDTGAHPPENYLDEDLMAGCRMALREGE